MADELSDWTMMRFSLVIREISYSVKFLNFLVSGLVFVTSHSANDSTTMDIFYALSLKQTEFWKIKATIFALDSFPSFTKPIFAMTNSTIQIFNIVEIYNS
ncbi:hypothetical protein RF11_00802 [Thelohanellus kitauei]|uniref:Uncharacterized protein n=1 Tax=Thelohanellus kitauei TaxID=669202 RepID=A0A0C2N5G4_THEKT|nr:hypothetical protein RF11_00802 [Thelohanellus kitauei]